MRNVALVVALAVLAGCQREPSFDERYGNAANQIQDRARTIDRDLEPPGNEAGQQEASNGSDAN